MKRISHIYLLVALLAALPFVGTQAQNPYKHSIGLSFGSFDGVSYKAFLTNELALQADLGFRILSTVGGANGYSFNMGIWTCELNPNLLYQENITGWNWGGVNWYAGGGLSLGFASDLGTPQNTTLGKFGINAIGGAELGLDDAPLAFSLDFRPGYGLIFSDGGSVSFFDWAIVAGIRYTF